MPQEMVCPKCGSKRTTRIKRIGLMQTYVWPLLERFPWECGGCRTTFLAKSRGKLKRKRGHEGEAHLPPVG